MLLINLPQYNELKQYLNDKLLSIVKRKFI